MRGALKRRAPFRTAPRSTRLWENFKSIAGALAIFLLLRAFIVEAYRIPSGSMIPTLLVGDWLFVNKAIFGAHVPFTSSSLPAFREPRRGDVVVFVSPYQADEDSAGRDPTPTLVKRLIGTPGDTLYMRKGVVYLNGIAQRQGYGINATPDSVMGNSVSWHFDWLKKAAITGSRFGAASRSTDARQLGADDSPAAQALHDGRQPLQLEGQSLLGFCSEGKRARQAVVRVLLVQCRRQRPAPSDAHRHPVDQDRSLD